MAKGDTPLPLQSAFGELLLRFDGGPGEFPATVPSAAAGPPARRASEASLAAPSLAGAWVPIRAFRLGVLRATRAMPRLAFLSSGSTQAVRARHFFSDRALGAYAAGATAGFVTFLSRAGLARSTPVVSLVPPPRAWPASSLAAMIAFFAQEGLDVRWCDVEGADRGETRRRLLADLESASRGGAGSAVVFGTSVHHVLVARALGAAGAPLPRLFDRLLVVDTGGTKGRTDSLTREDVAALLDEAYSSAASTLLVGSEYGMCELASQAYSTTFPHDGRFTCNATLRVRAVDPARGVVLPYGEEGFLAFIDELNVESHARVVTEDLGIAHDAGTFTLLTRAPDASLKGCSLNVRDTFLFSDIPPAPPVAIRRTASLSTQAPTPTPASTPAPSASAPTFSAARALASLEAAGVSAGLRADLREALEDLESGYPGLALRRSRERARAGDARPPLVVVASANVPVVIVQPLAWAWALGVDECVVKFPSLRVEDPLAGRVRHAMTALLAALVPSLPGLLVRRDDALAAHALEPPDARLLVFGSDATVATFEARYGARAHGLGDVTNAVDLTGLPDASARELLLGDATRYFGRGCLTPVAAFADASLDADGFARALSERLVARFAEEGCPRLASLLHHQDAAETRYLLAREGVVDPGRLERAHPGARVFDLRGLAAGFPFAVLPLGSGGSGFVYLLPAHARAPLGKSLGLHPTNPRLADPHVGESWEARLTRLLAPH